MEEGTFERVCRVVEKFAGRRIGVVGDMVADIYVYGSPDRLSREAPVIIVRYEGEEVIPGSAANTVNNLASLGAAVVPVGLLGRDSYGDAIRSYFGEKEIPLEGFLSPPGFQTHVKTRVMVGEARRRKQQVLRIDQESPFKEVDEKEILNVIDRVDRAVEGWILSDYGYDLISPGILERMQRLAAEKVVVADSRFRLQEFQGLTVLTPNQGEAESCTGIKVKTREDLLRMGRKLLESTGAKGILITRGNKGMALFEGEKEVVEIPALGSTEVVDVTGAGDTVVSVFTLAILAGANFQEAAVLSNCAAGVVVMRSRAATLSREDLLDALAAWRKAL